MRKAAKAVVFGIVYGISGFGLGENLQIKPKDAKKFIDKLLKKDSLIENYMESEESPGVILEFIGGEPLLEIDLID